MPVFTTPNTFITSTIIASSPMNVNFASIQTALNNIDNGNIGAAGIYASQIIPTTTAQATFGGTVGYVFGGSANIIPLTVTAAVGQTNPLQAWISASTQVTRIANTGQIQSQFPISPGGTALGYGIASLYSGVSVPTFAAPNGSLYVRYDGGVSNRMYVNNSGANSTGSTWIPFGP